MSVAALTLTLRPATQADDQLLFAVYASTRAEELALAAWGAGQQEAFLRHQFQAQSAHYREQYPGASFDVIEVDGQPVGRLYVARWEHELRVMDIALLPAWRAAGIGTQLLRDLLAEAAAAGKKASIHVEAENPARRLYERLGFVTAGRNGVYLLLEATPDEH